MRGRGGRGGSIVNPADPGVIFNNPPLCTSTGFFPHGIRFSSLQMKRKKRSLEKNVYGLSKGKLYTVAPLAFGNNTGDVYADLTRHKTTCCT